MSLLSIIDAAEADLNSINPAALINAIKTDITNIKADIAKILPVLEVLKPAIMELISLLPTNVAVPASVLTLLSKLPAPTTK